MNENNLVGMKLFLKYTKMSYNRESGEQIFVGSKYFFCADNLIK